MADYRVESSPQLYARTGGALYLALIVLGVFSEAVRDRVIVAGNPTATAAGIQSAEWVWRLGIVSEFVALVCATVLAMIYFVLLRPVSRELNLLATFLRLIAIAVQAIAVLNLDTALSVLVNAASANALSREQIDALASLAVRGHSHGWGLALLFFGATFLVHGHLIFRSGFLPRVIGILIQIAGLCYMTNSFALFLDPAIASRIFPLILPPAFVGEASLCLWLLVKGVNVEKWREVNAAFIA